jgi:hypothetical protein
MLTRLFSNRFLSLNLILVLMMTTLFAWSTNAAEARSRYYGHSRYYDRGGYRGGSRYGVDYKTGKILKGGLVGAGIGAGGGLLTGRSVGRTALIGAGLGAGVQATRYSRTMRRHPILKTAAYGALTGTGVSAMTGDGRRLGRGALWGGGIGAGLGALSHY